MVLVGDVNKDLCRRSTAPAPGGRALRRRRRPAPRGEARAERRRPRVRRRDHRVNIGAARPPDGDGRAGDRVDRDRRRRAVLQRERRPGRRRRSPWRWGPRSSCTLTDVAGLLVERRADRRAHGLRGRSSSSRSGRPAAAWGRSSRAAADAVRGGVAARPPHRRTHRALADARAVHAGGHRDDGRAGRRHRMTVEATPFVGHDRADADVQAVPGDARSRRGPAGHRRRGERVHGLRRRHRVRADRPLAPALGRGGAGAGGHA